ncbi:hypothetical protein CH282_21060 [Rhodococcus sp. 06-418-1B]|nr:hypothetical protein [Rhodococcus sp. 06-418-1B]OZC79190.1 hypothetical protein CH282_21060 [Rhodococcus sp. 06-418-1B]
MNAVLFDIEADAVVASQVTSLKGGASTSLPTAVEAMKAVAARRQIDVDAVGLVYGSADERDGFSRAIDENDLDGIQLVSASTALLGWLARSSEFDAAQCVLLYYLGGKGVSISLADATDASLSTPKTATLDSLTPERIGSTVPLAWEVLDEAGRKPDAVALFGDRSENKDLVDILSLGLGVPVVHVGDSDQIAACGASLAVAGDADEVLPVVVEPEASLALDSEASETPESVAEAPADIAGRAERGAVRSTVAPAPLLSAVAPNVAVRRIEPASSSTGSIPRKKFVLTAALLAGVLSGGVALASTLPANAPVANEASPATFPEVDGLDTSLVGATQSVEVTPPAPPAVPAPAPVVIDPVTQQPIAVDPTTQQWTIDPTTGAAVPAEALTPIPAAAIPPAAAVVPKTTVAPPEFAVPTIVPEPGKSQEQLEQEAWDRHWAHTAEWLQQEIIGN